MVTFASWVPHVVSIATTVFAVWALVRSRRDRRRLNQIEAATVDHADALPCPPVRPAEALDLVAAPPGQIDTVDELAGGPAGVSTPVDDEREDTHLVSLDDVQTPVMLLSKTGHVEHANAAASDLLGYPVETLRRMSFKNVAIPPIGASWKRSPLSVALETGAWSHEMLRVCEDSSCLPTQIDLQPHDSDDDQRVMMTLRDLVTERHMEREVVDSLKLATLSEVTAGLTHELANPLTAVLENARFVNEAFEMDAIDDDTKSAAGDVFTGAQRMRELLEAVRRFARMGREDPQDISFTEPLGAAAKLVEFSLRPHAKLVLPPADASPSVRADFGRVSQVLLNLIKNAGEAIRDAKVGSTITVRVGQTDREGWIEVHDDGPGISEAVQQRLFREYITTKALGRGTGLGLSLCARLLKEDRGRIVLDSSPETGTSFRVYLPLSNRPSLPAPEPFDPHSITLLNGDAVDLERLMALAEEMADSTETVDTGPQPVVAQRGSVPGARWPRSPPRASSSGVITSPVAVVEIAARDKTPVSGAHIASIMADG